MSNKRILMVIISAFTPFMLGLIILSKSGILPSRVFIPNSMWNDELLYYKQIESILSAGLPQGYYGYNESHAMFGTFASWSPLLYLPYSMIGALIGWNTYSPIICNTLFLSISLTALTAIIKPNYKQFFWIVSLIGSYATISRYLFSVCPEILIMSLGMLFLVFEYKYMENNNQNMKWSYWANTVGILLTLMRGYYCLLLLIDLYYAIKNRERKTATCYRVFTLIASPIAYILIIEYFAASYFIPLIKTNWIKSALVDPLLGIKCLFQELVVGTKEEVSYIIDSILMKESEGGSVGSWYLVFIIGMIWIVYRIIRTRSTKLPIVLIICIILQLTMTIVYYPYQGSRHVITAGILLMVLMALLENSNILKSFLLVLLVLITWFSKDTYTYSIPVESDSSFFNRTMLISTQKELTKKMGRSEEQWDNTVIWSISMDYHDLYPLPSGFGINLCFDEYIIENCHKLKAKYVAAPIEGPIAKIADDLSWEKVESYNKSTIWKTRE